MCLLEGSRPARLSRRRKQFLSWLPIWRHVGHVHLACGWHPASVPFIHFPLSSSVDEQPPSWTHTKSQPVREKVGGAQPLHSEAAAVATAPNKRKSLFTNCPLKIELQTLASGLACQATRIGG